MSPTRLLFAVLVIAASTLDASLASAIDVAPGTTSPALQAEGCATASGSIVGECLDGCFAGCILGENTTEASLDVSNYTVGKKFVESTAYTDFKVTPAASGAANGVDANVAYDVEWAGGWTLGGVFTGSTTFSRSLP